MLSLNNNRNIFIVFIAFRRHQPPAGLAREPKVRRRFYIALEHIILNSFACALACLAFTDKSIQYTFSNNILRSSA